MNKIKAVRGSKALQTHLKNIPLSISIGLDGGEKDFIYFIDSNTGKWTFTMGKSYRYEIVSLKEYLKSQTIQTKETDMKQITKAIRGCEKLRVYFEENGIDNLNGGYQEFMYWFNGEKWLHYIVVENDLTFEEVSFEEYINNIPTKIIKMKNTLYQVDEKFILEAHKAACTDWKLKIEAKFPKLFELPSVIGKKYVPGDNSYCICLENKQDSLQLITGGLFGKECIIISEPYDAIPYERKNNKEYIEKWGKSTFINVLYQNHTYMVLFNKNNVQ